MSSPRGDTAGRSGTGPLPFDLLAPLPQGTTVLEASAGTGKTYTIAALAVRLVAEGHVDLSELLLVTFGRAASRELRDRVRERFASVADGLARGAADDPLVTFLADGDPAEVQARGERLQRAIVQIDAATIETTHGFCQQMLTELGLAGDLDRDVEFVESVDDLVTEVTDDLFLSTFGVPGAAAAELDYAQARKAVAAAVGDPHARLVVHRADLDACAYQRFSLADAGRRQVAARMRTRHLMGYDDQLTLLRDALHHPESGAAARRRLRSRYRVAMVDEFQDTDPVQWDILRTAFHGHLTLVLIGDPKQAIYAFRGGDVMTYLGAVRDATSQQTLGTNWRSDAPLVAALQHLFRRAALGDEGIVVRPVDAHHSHRRLRFGDGAPARPAMAPLRIRVATRDQASTARSGLLLAPAARGLVAADVARDIVRRLTEDAVLSLRTPPAPVRPGDIAVLVRTNDQAALVRDALADVGVPAVIAGTSSVFATAMAQDWLVLLRALEQPHRVGTVRAAALTCFVGWSARDLAVATDDQLEELAQRVRDWREVLADRGVAALLETASEATSLPARLLGRINGERDLTDLRHVAEILHGAATRERMGTGAVVEWLGRRVAEAGEDPSEERSRRLESDAEAVQVVTVHSSKGLQFPLVYVPYGWDRNVPATPDPLKLHAPDGTRLLDVGGPQGDGYGERRATHRSEEAGEDLRLLYVAMTRAQCQVVTWWVPATTTDASPLHRLLFGDFGSEEQPPGSVAVPTDGQAWRDLQRLTDGSGGTIAIEPVAEPGAEPGVEPGADRWTVPEGAPVTLAVASFDRSLDSTWRRTSYSALTSAAHHGGAVAGVGSEPEQTERDDELDAPLESVEKGGSGTEEAMRSVPSPMADLPAGAWFGTVVHEVLELVDPYGHAPLGRELESRSAEVLARRLSSPLDPAELAAALHAVMETPLGPLAGQLRLRDLPRRDRLAEMQFELPLAGGDRPRPGDATVRDIAELVRVHLPPEDPLAGYDADLVAQPSVARQRLRGYLTGSIDAVLRVRDQQDRPRYLVVDYKTNRLGSEAPLTAWDYRPAALAVAMRRSHYPLQALLYAVALHRYLRWRQIDYDPERHLGGVLYLFVRGMCGPDTPSVDGVPCGVFSWHPPSALVCAVSDLLEVGAT